MQNPLHVKIVDDTDNYAVNLGISKERINELHEAFKKLIHETDKVSELLSEISKHVNNANELAYVCFKAGDFICMTTNFPTRLISEALNRLRDEG